MLGNQRIHGVRDRFRLVGDELDGLSPPSSVGDVLSARCCCAESRALTRVNHSRVAMNHAFDQLPWSSVCQCHRHSCPFGDRDRGALGMLVNESEQNGCGDGICR